jgi:DNA-binding GntR family transcriptional regulator
MTLGNKTDWGTQYRLDDVGIEKIEQHSLQEIAYRRIRNLILTNKLQPGQSLNLSRLAADLGVSQTPVREALALLQHDGLVTLGYYKTPQVVGISKEDVLATYEMRLVLEGWAVKVAAIKMEEEKIERLVNMINQVRKEIKRGDFDNYLPSDITFHGEIIAAVPNSLLSRLYGTVSDASLRIRTLVEASTTEHLEQVLDEHRKVLSSIEERDPEKAVEHINMHLNNARERTLNALGSIGNLNIEE